MKTALTTFTLVIFAGIFLLGVPSLEAVEPAAAAAPPAKALPDDTHFKSGEPVEADGFYQMQRDMEPNGISSGPATGCPYDEEALGQPLLG